MLIRETAILYIEHCREVRLVQPSTLKKYSEILNTWVVPSLGNKQVNRLTRVDIGLLRGGMFASNLSIARTYSVLMVLKGLLRYIKDTRKLETLNPAEVEVPNRGRPHVVFLTELELKKIFAAIPVHTFSGARLRAFIEVLLATGMRLGEALSLDREIFDAGATEHEIRGKGGKFRTVFFTDRCYYWVKLYLGKRFDSHPALFVTTGTSPERWRREDISRFFINLRDRAGINKKLTPHILRHTYCTNLRDRGVDISLIKELAGHADIGTTARYYLGTDKNVLRRIAQTHVCYESGEAT
ncbi:MAG: xerD [Acidobacteriales bacterium]|nr:xerD [Terriglobales bacterium]